jgi:hypothetical protein
MRTRQPGAGRPKDSTPVAVWSLGNYGYIGYAVFVLLGPAFGYFIPELLSSLGYGLGASSERYKLFFGFAGGLTTLYIVTILGFREILSRSLKDQSKVIQDQVESGLTQNSLAHTLMRIPKEADPAAALESVRNVADFIRLACNEHGGAQLGRCAFIIAQFKTKELQRLLRYGEGIDCAPVHYTNAFNELSDQMSQFMLIESSVPDNSQEFEDFLTRLKTTDHLNNKKEYILCCDPAAQADSVESLTSYVDFLRKNGFRTYWTSKQALARQGLAKDFSEARIANGVKTTPFHHVCDISGRRIAFTLYVEDPKDMATSRKDLVIAPIVPRDEFDQWLDACIRHRKELTSEMISAGKFA